MAELIADPLRAARLILALRQCGVTNQPVLKAMETIDRGSFAPPALERLAFEDVHLPLPCGQTIAPPVVTGQILAAVAHGDRPEGRALLIGAGSGYSSALLAGLMEHVVAVERVARLAKLAEDQLRRLGVTNVDARHADGLTGCAAYGPFDRIFAMGTLDEVPEHLFGALSRDGEMIVPVGTFERSELQVWRQGRRVSSEPLQSPLLPLRGGLSRSL